MRHVVLGTLLVGIGSGVIGTFAFLRKRALVGDAVAHSVLPGICLAFLLHGSRDLLVLLPGAFATGWLSLIVIDQIDRHSRIKTDAAIGLVLSVFFGIGVLLLTTIQKSGNAQQAGLDHFLFGKAAAIVYNDVLLFAVVTFLLVGLVILFYKEFQLISFDPDFARSSGIPVRALELLLATLTVLAVVTGIQAVGVVLMAALLITPAAAARYWSDKLYVIILLAAAFSALAAIFGSWVSYENARMPTGPWIIVALSILAFASMLLAPQRGFLGRALLLRGHRKKVNEENILKELYHASTRDALSDGLTPEGLMERRAFHPNTLRNSLQRLKRKGLIRKNQQAWSLTSKGEAAGTRLARIHRLWELYLTEYLRIAPDHVHDDAEAVEHMITPEIEEELEKVLGYPDRDPHGKSIPR